MGRVASVVILAASASLAACAPADGTRPARADASTGGQCFSATSVNNFRPVGRDAVDVSVSRNRVWRLTLGAGCFDVDWAQSVALRSRTGSFICGASDAELIVPSVGRGLPDRCTVINVRRLSQAEIDAGRNSRR